jgi:hypothetical protein
MGQFVTDFKAVARQPKEAGMTYVWALEEESLLLLAVALL